MDKMTEQDGLYYSIFLLGGNLHEKILKKLSLLAASALLAVAFLAAGCGSDSASSGSSSKNTTVTVGATPVPHGEILNEIKPLLAKEGVDLKVVEFTDYVKPNLALNDKELDANFFQHSPYLDKFNSEHGTKLKAIAKIHVEPMGIYSHKIKDLKDLPYKATWLPLRSPPSLDHVHHRHSRPELLGLHRR